MNELLIFCFLFLPDSIKVQCVPFFSPKSQKQRKSNNETTQFGNKILFVSCSQHLFSFLLSMMAIVKCVRFLLSCLDLITECKKKEKQKKYFMKKKSVKNICSPSYPILYFGFFSVFRNKYFITKCLK